MVEPSECFTIVQAFFLITTLLFCVVMHCIDEKTRQLCDKKYLFN